MARPGNGAGLPVATAKRLLQDLQEVLRCPIPGAAALPLEDLTIWHVNIQGQAGRYEGVVVHAALVFGSDYPAVAPRLRLFHALPHANARRSLPPPRGTEGSAWKLHMWDCMPGEDAWSSAYTVHTILLQLQAFLLDPALLFATHQVSHEEAVREARDLHLDLGESGHSHDAPFPPLPTDEQLQAAAASQRLRQQAISCPQLKQRSHQRDLLWTVSEDIIPKVGPAPAAPSGAAPHAWQATSSPPPLASKASAVTAAASGSSSRASASSAQLSASAHAGAGLAGQSGKAPQVTISTAVWEKHQSASKGAGGKSTAAKPGHADIAKSGDHSKGISKVVVPNGAAQKPSPAQKEADGWTLVARKPSKHSNKHHSKSPAKAPSTIGSTAGSSSAFKGHQGSDIACSQLAGSDGSALGGFSDAAGAADKPPALLAGAALPAPAFIPGAESLQEQPKTATAKRNAARSAKRARQREAAAVPATAAAGQAPLATAPSSPQTAGSTTPTSHASTMAADGWQGVPERQQKPKETSSASSAAGALVCYSRPGRVLISEAHAAHVAEAEALAAAGSSADVMGELGCPAGPMGPLMDSLPTDTLSIIMSLVQPRDLAALSMTCRGLRAVVEGGSVWQTVLHKEYPSAQLTASSAADWKHAYLMQAGNIAEDLHCFFTKATYQQAALGMPIRFTVNPRLKALDQIEAFPDLLSVQAFHDGQVTKTLDRQEAQAVLPLYITAEHWERVKAGKGLQKALQKLVPNQPSPKAVAWLEVLPKLLNTAVLLLMDKGVKASDRALASYCMLHRLSLALVEDFHLLPAVLARLDRFQSHRACRVKTEVPALGSLLALLSLTPATRHSWLNLGPLIVEEQLDRQILWICKYNPALQESLSKAPDSEPAADEELLKQSFEACKLGLRLVAFHVAFLKLIAKPAGSSFVQVMETYDMLYGRPPLALQKKMRAVTQRILALDDWTAFFRMIGFPMPDGETGPRVTSLLRRAWTRSLQKGYHKKGMDFSRVQAGGVSRLLLKGEKFSTPPNMKRITVLDHWRWDARRTFCYLDASCLVLTGEGRFIEAVDWSHRTSHGTSITGAVRHSGDQMDHGNCKGKHEINIALDQLGAHVMQLVIVVSAYAGAMLDDALQPFVSIQDPATKATLCDYHLEDQDKTTLHAHKNVVMCRFQRTATQGWQVQAVGHMMASGYASPSVGDDFHAHGGYTPIVKWIQSQPWHSK